MSRDLKVKAFNDFDFESDRSWLSHRANIELPAGNGNEAQALLRVKARWYKRTQVRITMICHVSPMTVAMHLALRQDVDFDIDWVTSAPPPAPTPSSAAPPPRSTPPPPRASSAPRPPPPSNTSLPRQYGSEQSQQYLFLLHAAMLFTTVFHILPVLPYTTSFTMFIWFFRLSLGINLYKLVLRFGTPPIDTTSLSNIDWRGLQAYAQSSMASNEFFYLMTSTSCLSLKSSITLAMLPMLVVLIRSMAAHASRSLHGSTIYQKFAAPLVASVVSRGPILDRATAFLEIALLFHLVALVVTPSRNLLMTYFYFSMLKTRYVAPDSSASHAAVWAKIDELSLPYRLRAPPMIERGIQMIRGYFVSVR